MKLKIFAGLVAILMVATALPFTNVGAQSDSFISTSTPIPSCDGSGNSGNYIKVGHVEVIYGNFGDGDVTVNAYQASITLTDDDGDGTVEAQ